MLHVVKKAEENNMVRDMEDLKRPNWNFQKWKI